MSLPKINAKEFLKKVGTKPNDNLNTIKIIEEQLKNNGGVFKMPTAGNCVILLLSGGLDSVVSWGILMEEYKLKVYPLTINKGQKKRKFEQRSVDFFTKYYQQRYPKLFVKPLAINVALPQFEINIEKAHQQMHPQAIIDNLNQEMKIVANLSLGSFTLSPILGKMYAEYLKLVNNVDINTIFCGVLPSDGDWIPEQCFTTLRTAMWHLRVTTHNSKWQFSSVCYEKETGMYLLKKDLIKWGYDHNIPLEKTWTCYFSYKKHCGQCASCYCRKENFVAANVVDNTEYIKEESNLLIKIKHKIKKIAKKVSSMLILNNKR